MTVSSQPAELDLQASAYRLGGKYQLLAELGRGGMATVYLAVATGPSSSFRKLTVIKRLREDVQNDPEFLQMFLEEARLAAQLSHPNVIHTYEVGEEAGRYYIAMEYLDGVSLQAIMGRLKHDGAFTFAHYARVLLDVLEGLAYAHNMNEMDGSPLNLVHRDISPHNILTTFDGQTKILDFGIAKAANSMVETRTGVIKGKVTYMSPEQAFSSHVDCTADLYAVGVMLWESVTGRRRWKGLQSAQVLQRLAMNEVPESCEAESHGLPADLDRICRRAMANEPADRYPNADEFAADLRKVFNQLPEQPTTRQIGEILSHSFEKERGQRKLVIEDRLRVAQHEMVTSLPMVQAAPASTTEGAGAAMALPGPVPGAVLATSGTNFTVIAPAGATKRAPIWAFAVAGVVLFAVGGYGLLRPKHTQNVPATNVPTLPPVDTAVQAKTPTMATVKLIVTPKDARLEVDGADLATGSEVITLPMDTRNHLIRVKAPGYREGERFFTTSDAAVSVTLEKLPTAWAGARNVPAPDKNQAVKPPEDKKPEPPPPAADPPKGKLQISHEDPFAPKK